MLMANRYGQLFVLLMRGPHPFGMVDGKGHRLFLVDVFAGVERGGEVFAVQVLRRGD